ncbi:MAG: hypothetical protein IJ717_09485 [Treponema sp.]|nr:hypothetical protein [Treponema sp.]
MESRIKTAVLMTFFAVLAFCFPAKIFPAEKDFQQRIEWKADKNALEYKVELRKVGGKSSFTTTTDSYMNLSLPAGDYEYRVYVYDILGRQSSVSAWKKFTILKANEPEISIGNPDGVENSQDGVNMDVVVESITAESKVELVNTETNESVQGEMTIERGDGKNGEEVDKASAVTFPSVESGEWRIRITNPSGLSSVSVPIRITKAEEKESAKEDTEKNDEPEKSGGKTEAEGTPEEGIAKTEDMAEETDGKDAQSQAEIRTVVVQAEPEKDMRQPKFISNEKEPSYLEDGRSFEINIDADKVSEDSVVELYDEKTGEVVKGKITVRGVKVTFPETKEGEWKLRITNSGGKSDTASQNITIGENPANKSAREQAEEEKRRLEEERRRQEEEKRKKAEPYRCRDVFVMASLGLSFAPYGELFSEHDDSPVNPTLDARAFCFPFKWQRQRVGLGVSVSYFSMDESNSYYDSRFNIFSTAFMGIYQFKLTEKMYVSADARLGTALLSRNMEYTNDAGLREQPGRDLFAYPEVGCGLSLFLVPKKFLALEFGIEFTHIAVKGIGTGTIEPRISAGLRL